MRDYRGIIKWVFFAAERLRSTKHSSGRKNHAAEFFR